MRIFCCSVLGGAQRCGVVRRAAPGDRRAGQWTRGASACACVRVLLVALFAVDAACVHGHVLQYGIMCAHVCAWCVYNAHDSHLLSRAPPPTPSSQHRTQSPPHTHTHTFAKERRILLMLVYVVAFLATSSAVVMPSAPCARPIRARHQPVFAIDMFGEAPTESAESELPEELMGPWELKCSVSGMESMWVQLEEEGNVSCSSKVGKGCDWSAKKQKRGYKLSFRLNDKMSRPINFLGEVLPDDTRGLIVDGEVRGAPKLRGATTSERERGVVIGEFSGFLLD